MPYSKPARVAAKTKKSRVNKTKSQNSKKSSKLSQFFSKNSNKRVLAVVAFAVAGVLLLVSTRAATPGQNCNSSGQGINGYKYPICRENTGAQLPIKYDIKSLPADAKYISPAGNDSNSGTDGSPFRTLQKAISASKTDGTIVVKEGTYREGKLAIYGNKSLRIVAYPGHSPVFSGSVPVATNWQAEGNLGYISYTPRPVTSGSGIDFAAGQNLNGDKVGMYPDQAWIGNTQLKQVNNKSELTNGRFWVDRTNNRMYLTATDSKKSNIEVSGDKGRFISIESPNSSLEGITVTRYSNGGNDYGVVLFQNSANGAGLKNVKVTDVAYMAVMFTGENNKSAPNPILKDNYAEQVTIEDAGWMGIVAHYTDNLLVSGSRVFNMNLFEEFTPSPQSGGIKANRTRYTKIINSDFSENKSYAIWFDMSNKDAEIANNILENNTASALFYEISDGLLLVNNYIKAQGGSQAVKTAGSSGLRIINNTIVGGKEPIGVYTDDRSRPGCADPSKPYCSGSWTKVRDEVRPYDPLIDFYPRVDLMVNNILAYPTAAGYCGKNTVVCFTIKNDTAVAPLETIIHKANASRGIPETKINNNVYVNDGSPLVVTPSGTYTKLSDFTAAMSASPVSISGIESNGKQGKEFVNSDGTPTASLISAYGQAAAIPSNTSINQYIPSGTTHFGVISAQASTQTTPPTTPPADNQPPKVTLRQLDKNYTQPVTLTLEASASDSDGAITKVEFYNGNTKLGEASGTGPHTFVWNDVPAGTYSLSARATDNQGASTSSTQQSITVVSKPNTPDPTVDPVPNPDPGADSQPPTTPGNLTRSIRVNWGKGRYVVDLKWSPSTDNSGSIASYQISRSGTVIGHTSDTKFTDSTSLEAGVNYTYTVVAKDSRSNVSAPATTSLRAKCFLIWCSID